MKFLCFAYVLYMVACLVQAFVGTPLSMRPSALSSRCVSSSLQMGWGDALNKAFSNEDFGDKKVNPGLKNAPNTCMVTVNGKTVQAVQGQKLRDVVKASGAKIEYNCSQGNCGTCESIVDGKKVRVCKAIVPRNKATLTVKTKFG
ncbi:unnamed protein product [Discosporangium mesarthrocarpum]